MACGRTGLFDRYDRRLTDSLYLTLLNHGNRTLDPAERFRKLALAEARGLHEMPIIPLNYQAAHVLRKPCVHALVPDPLEGITSGIRDGVEAMRSVLRGTTGEVSQVLQPCNSSQRSGATGRLFPVFRSSMARRNASFTAFPSRNARRTSGSSNTTFEPAVYRLAYFPRTLPFSNSVRLYSGRKSSLESSPASFIVFSLSSGERSRADQPDALAPLRGGYEQGPACSGCARGDVAALIRGVIRIRHGNAEKPLTEAEDGGALIRVNIKNPSQPGNLQDARQPRVQTRQLQ